MKGKKNFSACLWMVSLQTIFAVLIFVYSMAHSEAEAYTNFSLLSLLKWSLIGFLINIAFPLSITSLGRRSFRIILALMIFGVFVNSQVFTNPFNLVIINFVGLIAMIVSLTVIRSFILETGVHGRYTQS